ncbi:GntR family transcriptional regulator [Homoserinibacter sp. YIM 151385]|uniref:GntR family transcriptional regulator n=1 Tax=Homoserinibacter sp. YIM 151385 TaxID=2985506 RepID=UPI0022F04623|nr:GntR family transcriptional regulator [Homoserinibacter sp. YIM 151385]WBU36849.1 GntR family transcriptional regulator [Homoserinibacter sp. YIM 151385]
MQRAPMYRVIYDDIVAQIRSGVLEPAAQLPSEHELAKQYGVSRMTVRQAMDLLGSDELVIRKQGSGTFVREHARLGRRFNRLRSFADELVDSEVPITSEIVRAELAAATPAVAAALRLDVDDPVSRLTRVRLVDGVPAALQDAWVPYAIAPGITREPLVEGSLYRTLAERHHVELRWADQSMTAALLGEEEAALLRVPPGGAVLHGLRTTYSTREEPVEFTSGWTLPSFPLLLRIDAE